jgi:predicted secreted protein
MRPHLTRKPSIIGLLAFAAVVGLVGVAFWYSRPGPAFTEDNNGQTVGVRVGDTVTVRLHESPSTGYHWDCSVSAGLKIVSSDYSADDITGMFVGSGGTRTWKIQALTAGTQRFDAANQPPDKAKAPQGHYSLSIDVGG